MVRRLLLSLVHNVLDDPHDLLVLHCGLAWPLHRDILVLLVRRKLTPWLQASLLRPLDQVEFGLGDPEADTIIFILKFI